MKHYVTVMAMYPITKMLTFAFRKPQLPIIGEPIIALAYKSVMQFKSRY